MLDIMPGTDAKPVGQSAARATLRYPFLKPNIPPLERILPDLGQVYENGWFTNMGPYERALTSRISDLLDGHAVSVVSSCTAGLMLGLRATVTTDRREVLVPSYTFVGTISAIDWSGLTPLFADIEPSGWQMDPGQEKAILARKDRIGAILLCNTFGAPSNVDAWTDIARRLEVPLLVDSAAGFGGSYPDGRPQGTKGTAEFMSAHATKPFAVGEGGVVVSDDEELIGRLEQMKNFGFDANRISRMPGMNAKMPEFLAVVGIHSLVDLPGSLERRRKGAVTYRQQLRGFTFQEHGDFSTYPFLPALLPAGSDRTALIRSCLARGLEVRDYYATPSHEYPFGSTFPRLGELSVTREVASRAVCLPMYDDISAEDVAGISSIINELV